MVPFAVIVIGLLVYNSSVFKLTGSSPRISDIATVSPYISINFSKNLSKDGLVVSSSPNITDLYDVKGKTLQITISRSLNPKTDYSITIHKIYSSNGSVLSNMTFNFRPVAKTFDKLSALEQSQIFESQSKDQIGSLDPIMSYLPYETLSYKLEPLVTASSTVSKISIDASIYVSKGQLSTQDAVVAQYKAEINDYIKSIGLDPATYDIQYQILLP